METTKGSGLEVPLPGEDDAPFRGEHDFRDLFRQFLRNLHLGSLLLSLTTGASQ